MTITRKVQGLFFGSLILLSGCATTPPASGSWQVRDGASLNTPSEDMRGQALDNADVISAKVNEEIVKVFSADSDKRIKLWVADTHNLVDGMYTSTFGDKLSPDSGIKMQKILHGSGVMTVDPLHVPPCTGVEDSQVPHWVLRTYVTNLDENLTRSVQGFFPSIDSSDVQGEIDIGNREVTDRFGLKAKITNCRNGQIIHGAESEFIKTASSRDRSFYLFGKSLGAFYRKSKFTDPGLNQTKDLAMDVFLSNIAMDMVGVPQADRMKILGSTP